VPLVVASLTGPLVTFATHVIHTLGLVGVAVMTMTSGVIGIPGSEPTMLFAGFDVYKGHQTLAGIIVAGVIGDMLGATIAYAIGYWGRRELLERHGAKIHMTAARLDRPSRWFDRHGSPVVFVSRFIPGVRAVFPYAAGVSRMPFGRFFAFATLGSIAWIAGLGVLGREVGRDWSTWRRHLEYGDYALFVLVALAIIYLVVRRLRSSRERSGTAVETISK
jgi:membrane protein DedA with SNARE-associated domain